MSDKAIPPLHRTISGSCLIEKLGESLSAIKAQDGLTDAELGKFLHKGTARIVDAFDFLETAGMIEIEVGNACRVVTISATGKRTSGDVRKRHWSRHATPTPETAVDPDRPFAECTFTECHTAILPTVARESIA